jgi:hypothetical protein
MASASTETSKREYTNNHYVPQWYQKRFATEAPLLWYLDMHPPVFHDSKGRPHAASGVRRRGTRQCFKEEDLYTQWFGEERNTVLERFFFGRVDTAGRRAVDYFATFKHPSVDREAWENMMTYMTVQKLRTPKGLDWLASQIGSKDRAAILARVVELQQLFAAVWSECIWQIADAAASSTKFIVSDHPVTIYNRELGPRNKTWCRGANDPDIGMVGSHTIFPLSLDKVLMLTNLSWVRNPYQSAKAVRPNPELMRSTFFNFTSIQTHRALEEEEVRQINFIIKSRAYRYIAAAEKDWLYPERFVSRSDWNTYGDGLLVMPDPRPVHYGGEVIFGFKHGPPEAFDEFGRRPWQPGYGSGDPPDSRGTQTLYRFQGEFARKFGPKRRGRSFSGAQLDPEEDSPSLHRYYVSLGRKDRRKS